MDIPSDPRAALGAAIKQAGSARQLADLLGVHRSAVTHWRRTGVPAGRAREIQGHTGILMEALRPDLFAPVSA